MTQMPEWMKKHPCVGCNTGYGECIQFWPKNIMCCIDCRHPGRWQENPYTKEDYAEMGVVDAMDPPLQAREH